MSLRYLFITLMLSLTLVACGKKGDLESPRPEDPESVQLHQELDADAF